MNLFNTLRFHDYYGKTFNANFIKTLMVVYFICQKIVPFQNKHSSNNHKYATKCAAMYYH